MNCTRQGFKLFVCVCSAQSPFWRATSPPRSSSSPFYSMQSSVGGRSSRQHGVSPSIVVGDGPSHQRTASMPVVNTIQPLPELDLINESEASRPTRGTTMYSTLPRKWPKTTEGDGDRLKPERGHVRRHSADFNAPTSGTPVQQPPQVATSAPPKVPPVPPGRISINGCYVLSIFRSMIQVYWPNISCQVHYFSYTWRKKKDTWNISRVFFDVLRYMSKRST